MLFRETVPVYCVNHREHTDALCGENAEFLNFEIVGTYSDLYALEVLLLRHYQMSFVDKYE
jgi:hypothetical protein